MILYSIQQPVTQLGSFNGIYHLLEKKSSRDILYLPYWHHVYKIVLSGVFIEVQLAITSRSDIQLFKKICNG